MGNDLQKQTNPNSIMAGILQALKEVFTGKKTSVSLAVGKGYTAGQAREDMVTDYSSYLNAGTGNVWATFKACDLVANAVMSTTFDLIREQTGKVVTNDRTGISELLRTPNAEDTFEDLMYLYAHHIKLTGNFFLLKDNINPVTKLPRQLYPLMPHRIKLITSKTGMGEVIGYEYKTGRDVTNFRKEDIIHFRRPNPSNRYWGLGDIEAGRSLYNDFIQRDRLNSQFQKNGGLPSGVLVNEEFDGDISEWERVKNIWASQYAGQKNIGKIAWLTGKWNFLKLGLTADQMQQLERDKANTQQIFLNHGVPLSICGMDKAANYATARQDYINFKRFTCYPLSLSFFRELNRSLIKNFDEQYKLDFSVNGLVDGKAVIDEFLPYLDKGVITPNELRSLAGLPRSDNPLLDGHYINTQVIPLEMVGLANSFGSVPSEIMETQVENAGGDPDRFAEETQAEAEGEIDKQLLSMRNRNGNNGSWNGE